MAKSLNNEARSRKERSLKQPRSRGRMFITATILIGFIMAGGALAHWPSLWSVAQNGGLKVVDLAPTSFSTPSKEYIYAGDKLVATEEPAGSSCSYSISPPSQSFPGNGSISGSAIVTVTTATGCNWTAFSNASFINITSGSSGTGNGTVQYSVAANGTTAIRNGTLTIAGQTFTVYQGINFADVPTGSPYYSFIGRLVARGVTVGCQANPPLYCPAQSVTREQMAAFIIKGLGEFNPPPPPTQRFNDVQPSSPFYPFVDRLAVLNITAGCSATPPLYCPTTPIPHEQMAVFIIKALGMTNPPAPATQRFTDVPPTSIYYRFIDQMAERGIWTGCGGGNYCPSSVVTREQMAAMLVRAFNL
jgi:hypothetical protein